MLIALSHRADAHDTGSPVCVQENPLDANRTIRDNALFHNTSKDSS